MGMSSERPMLEVLEVKEGSGSLYLVLLVTPAPGIVGQQCRFWGMRVFAA